MKKLFFFSALFFTSVSAFAEDTCAILQNKLAERLIARGVPVECFRITPVHVRSKQSLVNLCEKDTNASLSSKPIDKECIQAHPPVDDPQSFCVVTKPYSLVVAFRIPSIKEINQHTLSAMSKLCEGSSNKVPPYPGEASEEVEWPAD